MLTERDVRQMLEEMGLNDEKKREALNRMARLGEPGQPRREQVFIRLDTNTKTEEKC